MKKTPPFLLHYFYTNNSKTKINILSWAYTAQKYQKTCWKKQSLFPSSFQLFKTLVNIKKELKEKNTAVINSDGLWNRSKKILMHSSASLENKNVEKSILASTI